MTRLPLWFRRGVFRQYLRDLIGAGLGILLGTIRGRPFIFYGDVNGVVGLIAEVFDFVLDGREPAGLSGLGEDFLHLAVLVGELDVYKRQRATHRRYECRVSFFCLPVETAKKQRVPPLHFPFLRERKVPVGMTGD